MKLFLSPHNDDEAIFGSFLIMREKPQVVVVYDSCVQPLRGIEGCGYITRRTETRNALMCMGAMPPKFVGLRDDQAYTPKDILFRLRSCVDVDQVFDAVYAPIYDGDGHGHHNAVSLVAAELKSKSHVYYSTYTRSGGRQTTPNEVLPESGDMIARKHLALASYKSQMIMDARLGTWPWFVGDMREYIA